MIDRYRNRQDLTDSKFVIHPGFGKRCYRTGDRGMLLWDGSLVIHGRIDREVKVRGTITFFPSRVTVN